MLIHTCLFFGFIYVFMFFGHSRSSRGRKNHSLLSGFTESTATAQGASWPVCTFQTSNRWNVEVLAAAGDRGSSRSRRSKWRSLQHCLIALLPYYKARRNIEHHRTRDIIWYSVFNNPNPMVSGQMHGYSTLTNWFSFWFRAWAWNGYTINVPLDIPSVVWNVQNMARIFHDIDFKSRLFSVFFWMQSSFRSTLHNQRYHSCHC